MDPAQSDAHRRILARLRECEDAALAVYLRERDVRQHWPRSFAEAVKVPTVAASILMLTLHAPAPTTRRPVCIPPAPPLDDDPPAIQRPLARTGQGRRAQAIDGKSLAAGEKPDSDD